MKNSRRRACLPHDLVEEVKSPQTSTSILFPTIRSLQPNRSYKPIYSSFHKLSEANQENLSHTITGKPCLDDSVKNTEMGDKLPVLPKVRNLILSNTKLTAIANLEAAQRGDIEAEETKRREGCLQSRLCEAGGAAPDLHSKSSWASDCAHMQAILDGQRYSHAYLSLSALMVENKDRRGRLVVLTAMRAFCSYQMYNYTECADDSQMGLKLLMDVCPGEEVGYNPEEEPLVSVWLNARFVFLWTRSLLLSEAYNEAEMVYNFIFSQATDSQTVSGYNIFNLTEDDLSLLRAEQDCLPQICSFRQYVHIKEWSNALAVMKSKVLLEFIEATSLRFYEAVVLFENGLLDAAREVLLVYLAQIPFHGPPSSPSDNLEYCCQEEKQLHYYIKEAYLNANLFLSKVGLYCGREYMNIAAVLIQRCLAVNPIFTPAIHFGCHLVALEDFISKAESEIEEGRFQSAVKLITDALAMDNKNNRINAFLFIMRAEAYLKLCRPLQAIEDCTKSIMLDATHAKTYLVRSIAFQRTQKTAEAAADRCMAVQLNSSYRDFPEATDPNLSNSQSTSTNKGFGSNYEYVSDKKPEIAKATFYDILGVRPCATLEDIRQAFKYLTLRYHPDKVVNEPEAFQRFAVDRFKELNQAHSVLMDPEKRLAYDSTLRTV
ncbi:unnamed protein product [Phytomonas sp. Hart1]|nr:unnamed protein product [Phytomonas sp. Hart1]|eukprot:CCW67181.1 unnamed protein product [Phytomonas sp. isolate Hart1]